MTMGLTTMDRYEVYDVTLDGGERLPVVVDSRGIPPLVPHWYLLHRRKTGVAFSTLHAQMVRIAELYDLWNADKEVCLDKELLVGTFPDRRDVLALFVSASRGASKATVLARCSVWSEFLEWVADEHNWWPRARTAPERTRVEDRLQQSAALAKGLREEAYALSKPSVARRKIELRRDDVDAIRKALGPDVNGGFAHSPFAPTVRLRNYLLFCLLRHLGVRRGEALALKVTSLARLSERDELARQFPAMQKPQMITVQRIPDDPDNPRKRVAVKRNTRTVPIPNSLASLWWRYVDGEGPEARPHSTSPFLLLTEGGEPLSYSAVEKIVAEMGEHANTALVNAGAEASDALSALTPHAFRHFRAVEALSLFFPNGQDSPGSRAEYMAYFGWKRIDAALPYIRRIHERTAHHIANQEIDS